MFVFRIRVGLIRTLIVLGVSIMFRVMVGRELGFIVRLELRSGTYGGRQQMSAMVTSGRGQMSPGVQNVLQSCEDAGHADIR